VVVWEKVKRRKSKNTVKISFAATILVLSLITLIAYSLSFRIPSYDVPSNLPAYGGLVGNYAPADSLQVSFANYSAVRAINSSAVLNKQLVDLVKPSIVVHLDSVQAVVIVTILNTAQNINNTGTAAVLDRGAYSNLSRALTSSTLAPTAVGSYDFYRVNDSSNGRTKTEWLTLVPSGSSVLFAEGGSDAMAVMERMLNVWDGTAPSILTVQNVTRMLYPVGGTSHLALSIQNFTGAVQTGQRGVLAVDVANGAVQLTNVVQFASSSYASSQVSEMKGVYKFSGDFSQYAENLKAVQSLSMTNLEQAVALTGV
jgi:hypothetical protein